MTNALNRESGWFGDRRVSPDQKTSLVGQVFQNVAGRYDLMNDLMSGGVHRFWKASFLKQIALRGGERVVDVAGGTGDIALGLAEAGPDSVVICDLTPDMVAVARDRAAKSGVGDTVRFSVGNAESLPFADRSMDVYTIAFGLRNVTRIDLALAEAHRVLRPGGRFFCLEFSRVVIPALRAAYEQYSDAVIPRLGRFVAGDEDSYRYLVESIRRFPSQRALAARMGFAGLSRVSHRNLSGGIAAVHQGWRL